MIVLEKEKVVYCDVDDTLVLWQPEKYPHKESDLISFEDEYGEWKLLPHKQNLEFLLRVKQQGYGIVIWSAAGSAWAKKVVEKLKIEHIADIVLAKPELAIDDLLQPDRIIKSVLWIDPLTEEYKRNK